MFQAPTVQLCTCKISKLRCTRSQARLIAAVYYGAYAINNTVFVPFGFLCSHRCGSGPENPGHLCRRR